MHRKREKEGEEGMRPLIYVHYYLNDFLVALAAVVHSNFPIFFQIGSLEDMYLFALDVEGNGDTSIRRYNLKQSVSDHPSVRLGHDSEV